VKPGAAEPTTVAGRYRLDSLIASGGMAEVWRAHDARLDREVAVKLPLAHLRSRPDFIERFRREAVAAARLNHPRVVRVYDTGSDADLGAFIVMELVDGPSLKAILAQGGLALGPAVELAAQVAGALDFAHRAGVIHRDIKPANVLVAPDGPKVADFGIAKAVTMTSDMTETGVTMGTARYLSPEQVEGKTLDARSDIYSLGVVLYELLSGQPPFDADTDLVLALKHVTTEPKAPSSSNPSVPAWLDDLVIKALAKDPSDRFADAAEMARALRSRPVDAQATAPALAGAALAQATPTTAAGGARWVGGAGDATSALAPEDPTTGWTTPAGTQPEPAGGPTSTPAPIPAPVPGRPSGGFGPRSRLWYVGAAAVALVLVAAVAGLVSARLGNSGHPGSPPVTAPGQSSVQIPVSAAHSLNPAPGSGTEHEELVGNLIDGNPSTYWHTQQYTNPSFGNLKDGVGVYLQLRSPAKLGDLVISSPDTGWSYQVYEADQPSSDLAGWGRPVASGTVSSPSTSKALGGRQAGYVLVWVTHLSSSNQVRIGELSLFS
jgi:serine/threonine-protein kinase